MSKPKKKLKPGPRPSSKNAEKLAKSGQSGSGGRGVPPHVPIPTVNIPKVQIPEIKAPEIQLPKVEIPHVRIPKVQLPEVNLPKQPGKGSKKAAKPNPKAGKKPEEETVSGSETIGQGTGEEPPDNALPQPEIKPPPIVPPTIRPPNIQPPVIRPPGMPRQQDDKDPDQE